MWKLLGVLALAAVADAEKKKMDCGTAMVISQEISTETRGVYETPLANGRVSVPINVSSNHVVIETDKTRLELVELGRGLLLMTTGTRAEACSENGLVVFFDSKKKKHKFAIVGMRKLATEIDPQTQNSGAPRR